MIKQFVPPVVIGKGYIRRDGIVTQARAIGGNGYDGYEILAYVGPEYPDFKVVPNTVDFAHFVYISNGLVSAVGTDRPADIVAEVELEGQTVGEQYKPIYPTDQFVDAFVDAYTSFVNSLTKDDAALWDMYGLNIRDLDVWKNTQGAPWVTVCTNATLSQPMTEKPANGTIYWMARIDHPNKKASIHTWQDRGRDNYRLENGLCFEEPKKAEAWAYFYIRTALEAYYNKG